MKNWADLRLVSVVFDSVEYAPEDAVIIYSCHGCHLRKKCIECGEFTKLCSNLIGNSKIFKRKTDEAEDKQDAVPRS